MKFSKVAATSALVIAAMGIATGTSHADTAPAPSPVIGSLLDGVNQGINQVVPSIGWNVAREGDSIVVTTTAGSLNTADGQFQVLDNQGNLVTALPLSYTLADAEYPIDAAVDGLRATLTPRTDAGRPIADGGLRHEVANQEAFDDAISAAATQFGLATAIGTLVGTIVGAAAGCVLGGISGAVLGIPILDAGGLAPLGGCLAGAIIGIPLGAAAGLILTGVPAAIIIGIGLVNRLNDPANQ
ncbi:hypothetical protein ACWDOP_13275 [Nocardia sp. NPDC003693]